jgi:hypothetical protein
MEKGFSAVMETGSSWRDAMADPFGTVDGFLRSILQDPVYVLITVGGIALVVLLAVAHHIHKIRNEDIFVHQAWGANWKGR